MSGNKIPLALARYVCVVIPPLGSPRVYKHAIAPLERYDALSNFTWYQEIILKHI